MSKSKESTMLPNVAETAGTKLAADSKTNADADAAASAKEHKLVKMRRIEPVHPDGPITANVHPDEVDNWIAGGWRRAG